MRLSNISIVMGACIAPMILMAEPQHILRLKPKISWQTHVSVMEHCSNCISTMSYNQYPFWTVNDNRRGRPDYSTFFTGLDAVSLEYLRGKTLYRVGFYRNHATIGYKAP